VELRKMEKTYDGWLNDVQVELQSMGMGVEAWQRYWQFDFHSEYKARTSVRETARKANRFWWQNQNRALMQDCPLSRDCWLPVGHEGDCETVGGEPVKGAAIPWRD
jgi:hypothetical protein